jgi:hypothetical protein
MLALLASSGTGCLEGAYTAAKPTALERQLLGAYDELEAKLVHASSVRAEEGPQLLSFEAIEASALEARALQRFNEDDVVELKGAGCLAEGLGARLLLQPCSMASQDPATQRRLERVLGEENRAREAVLRWAAHTLARQAGKSAPSERDVAELRLTYQRLLRETATQGQLFEVAPGTVRPVTD